MNKAAKWLTITWPVVLIAAALVVAGMFIATRAPGIGALVGLGMTAYGAYWGWRGITPERDGA